jgi:hypothetical protein
MSTSLQGKALYNIMNYALCTILNLTVAKLGVSSLYIYS